MIVVYAIGWIWGLIYWLPIDFNKYNSDLFELFQTIYFFFMLIMNVVQPTIQASLAAYISYSYDVGVLTKT